MRRTAEALRDEINRVRSAQSALGAGVGLERLASLRYAIDDIRKMATALVA